MRESAPPGDTRYLLRELDHTPLRFRLAPTQRADSASPEPEASIIAYFADNPGATVSDLHANLPMLAAITYGQVRTFVARLVDTGVLQIAGRVGLEEVDARYERVQACDLCGSPSHGSRTVLWKHNTPVVRCSSCGLLYANPRWKREHLFGRYDHDYWADYDYKVQHMELDHAANERPWKSHLDNLDPSGKERRGPGPGRLLDVGCATGEFLAAARARGWDTYGVEPSPPAAQEAASASGSPIHNGTLDTAAYATSWFDVITMWDVIEHLQSPRAYIEQAARLLKPGGACLASPHPTFAAWPTSSWDGIGPR